MQSVRQALSGAGLLTGVIIGAGMFALPYVTVQAGLFWALAHMFGVFCILTAIHILYGKIVYATRAKHRLPGYARLYLGENARRFAIASTFFEFYGALLIYGLLGGGFLYTLFGSGPLTSEVLTVLFFLIGALFLGLSTERLGAANFILTSLLLGCIAVLIYFAAPQARVSNIPFKNDLMWFLPYGVFLFSFAGASAIPDMADIFKKKNKPLFQRVVVLSTLIPLIVYTLFILFIAGVSGLSTSREAIQGLEQFLGRRAVILGSLIGFFAVFTSFVSMGLDLRNTLEYDYKWKRHIAWASTVLVPLLLFMIGFSDFIKAIGLVGGIAVGIDGILILLIALRLKRIGWALPTMLATALLFGILYELMVF